MNDGFQVSRDVTRDFAWRCGLLERHLTEIDEQIERLLVARTELLELAERARTLDPTSCTDPHRCQVIAGDG